jgi:hypothetical protein
VFLSIVVVFVLVTLFIWIFKWKEMKVRGKFFTSKHGNWYLVVLYIRQLTVLLNVMTKGPSHGVQFQTIPRIAKGPEL